jgi:hypothetical protein
MRRQKRDWLQAQAQRTLQAGRDDPRAGSSQLKEQRKHACRSHMRFALAAPGRRVTHAPVTRPWAAPPSPGAMVRPSTTAPLTALTRGQSRLTRRRSSVSTRERVAMSIWPVGARLVRTWSGNTESQGKHSRGQQAVRAGVMVTKTKPCMEAGSRCQHTLTSTE